MRALRAACTRSPSSRFHTLFHTSLSDAIAVAYCQRVEAITNMEVHSTHLSHLW